MTRTPPPGPGQLALPGCELPTATPPVRRRTRRAGLALRIGRIRRVIDLPDIDRYQHQENH